MDTGTTPNCGILRRFTRPVHRLLLVAALVLLPMGGLTDQVGLFCLGLAAGAAIPECIARWRFLVTRPTILLWIAWWILAFVSVAWSPDPTHAHQQGAWALLAVPAMVPVIAQPRWWMYGLAAGVAGQAVIQILGWAGWIEGTPRHPFQVAAGFYHYAPNVALWAFTSMLLTSVLVVSLRIWTWRIVILVLAAATAVGVVMTMNRSSWIIASGGLVVVAIRWACSSHRPKGQWVWPTITVLLLGGILSTSFVQFKMSWRIEKSYLEVETFVETPPTAPSHTLPAPPVPNPLSNASAATTKIATATRPPVADVKRFDSSFGKRVIWWHAGWELLKDRPFIGHGAGSIRRSLAMKEAEMPSQWGAGVPDFITWNPHASLVATAIEQGGLGVLLLLAIAIGVAIGAWRRGRTCAALIGLGPAWIGLLLFSLTHAVLLEPYTSVLVSILLVATLPSKEDPAKVHPAQ